MKFYLIFSYSLACEFLVFCKLNVQMCYESTISNIHVMSNSRKITKSFETPLVGYIGNFFFLNHLFSDNDLCLIN